MRQTYFPEGNPGTCPVSALYIQVAHPDAAAVRSDGEADRWTVASVGIAQAATPKKPISISPRNGEVSEKLVLEAGATGFQDPKKGGWEPVGPFGRKNRARRARLEANGCILATTRESKS